MHSIKVRYVNWIQIYQTRIVLQFDLREMELNLLYMSYECYNTPHESELCVTQLDQIILYI